MAELAKKLPSGRIYAQGRAFIPFIKRELYDKVCAASGGHVRMIRHCGHARASQVGNSNVPARDFVGSPVATLPMSAAPLWVKGYRAFVANIRGSPVWPESRPDFNARSVGSCFPHF